MSAKIVSGLIAAVAVGFAAGYFVAAPDETAKPVKASAVKTRAVRNPENDMTANVPALRRRVQELEKRLAEMTRAAAALSTNALAAAERPVEPRRGFGFGPPNAAEMRARMEEMREKEPERYAQMTNRMAQWRQNMARRTSDRLEFFASLDTAAMSPKQRANHEKLQSLLARQDELMQQLNPSDTSITDAQREKNFREMHEMRHQIHDLEQAERDMLLHQTARNLGYKGADAREVVETIKTIYDATQSFGGPHGGRGRRGSPSAR